MLKTLPRSPVILAVILGAALVLWLLSGDNYSAQQGAPAAQQLPEKQLPQVETRWSEAQPYQATQVAQGQILPWRSISIKAQQAGRIEALLKQQGDSVQQGEPLLQISDEGRSAKLAQAKANLTLRKSELDSARALGKAQFLSATELTRLQSELTKAEAEWQTASLALSQTRPEAPFNAMLDRRHIEVGDVVQSGTELLQLVQIDQLKVTAQIPQQHIGALQTGQQANIRLLDGRKLTGELSFISYAADNATRSFYIEVTVANPQQWRIAGASATRCHRHTMGIGHFQRPDDLLFRRRRNDEVTDDIIEFFLQDRRIPVEIAAFLFDQSRIVLDGDAFQLFDDFGVVGHGYAPSNGSSSR